MIEVPFVEPVRVPAVSARHKTIERRIFANDDGGFTVSVTRAIIYLGADGKKVPPPPDAELGYAFNFDLTPEVLAANLAIKKALRDLADLEDASDPRLVI